MRYEILPSLFAQSRLHAAATNTTNTGPAMPNDTALVTLAAIALYFFIATRVAAARVRFGIKHPATVGNPDFERVFRAHVNMLEWMPTFLVPLWLCAIYLSDVGAAAIGLVWIAGRAVYFAGYSQAVEKRLPGFFIQVAACLLLFVGAATGIVMRLVGG
jgi:glutathione S-transferase